MGIKNILCTSCDHQKLGNHPTSKNVYDLDSIQLIAMVKKMRDYGKFLNDDDIDIPPKMFIGATANPFADPQNLESTDLPIKLMQELILYKLNVFIIWKDFVNS